MPESDALSTAREFLPWWATWGAVLAWPAFALVASVLLRLTSLGDLRAASDRSLHWTERARHNYRVGIVDSAAHLVLCVLALIAALVLNPRLSPISGGVIALITYLVAWIVRVGWRCYVGRRVLGLTPQSSIAGLGRAMVMGGLPLMVLVAMGLAMPFHPSPSVIVFGALLTGGSVAMLMGLGPRVLERTGLAQRVDAAELGLPASVLPDDVLLFEADLGYTNAFAYGWARTIVVTKQLRELLEPRQLESVLRHELGHLNEKGLTQLVRLSGLAFFVVLAWVRPSIGWFGPQTGAWLLGGAAVAVIYALSKSRKLEERADVHAHEDGLESDYARALERIHVANLVPAVLPPSRLLTHPDLVDRMRAAGVEPDWPIPAPPNKRPPVLAQVGNALLLLVGFLVFAAETGVADRHAASLDRSLPSLALGVLGRNALCVVAIEALERDESERALVLFRAAVVLEPDNLVNEFGVAWALARLGRCEEARACLSSAQDRLDAGPVREGLREWRELAAAASRECGR